MWLAPYVQNSREQGGKGGPEQQTFSYTQSIAIGLAERVDDSAPDQNGAIGGITRIWENGAIVYDIRPQQQASTELNTLGETDQQYADRLTASATYAETFTLYLGDELQEPDPTIEATQGVGLTPPFRGLAYIVYPNRNLTIAQGLRHPNFQFEVYSIGVGDCFEQNQYSNDILYPWFDTRNEYSFSVVSLPAGVSGPTPIGTIFDTAAEAIAVAFAFNGINQTQLIGYTVPPIETGGATAAIVPLSTSVAIGSTTSGVTVDPSVVTVNYNFRLPTDGIVETQAAPPGSLYATPGKFFWAPGNSGSNGSAGLILVTSTPDSDFAAFPPWDFPYTDGSRYTDFFWFETVQDLVMLQSRAPGPPDAPCAGLLPAPIPGYCLDLEGNFVKATEWVLDTSTTYAVLQKWVPQANPDAFHANYETIPPLNPCVPIGDPNYANETYWTAAYDAAVTAGKIASGKTYGVDYPQTQTHAWVLDSIVCSGAGSGVSVGAITQAICKRSGLTAVDVTDINAITVDGYAISSVCSGSSIISPLRSIAFFDAIETDGLLKFATRGKPIVATFTTDDFGCYDSSQGIDGSDSGNSTGASTCPPSITTTRSQDEDLPRSIRFHYIATSRDYEDAEQDSPFRLATAATNDVDITVAVCLGDTQAAQCASVLWADSWSARSAFELSIDQSWLQLDVGDCIAVPVDGVIQRLRIANDTNSSAVLRKLSCVKDDGGAYISFAVSTPPNRIPQRLSFIGGTDYEMLDLPCLQDADSDPGFYIAAQSDGTGTWKGAQFYKSIDGGATFSTLFALLQETPMGTVNLAVPVSQAYTWDMATEIIVNVASHFSFESVTDDAVLAGANAAAMGADGRWEVVQFATATQVTATQWSLTRLLRGRRGTEHVIGSSRIGDAFVMLSGGTIGRVVLQTTEIGAARVYRGTSIGATFTSGAEQTFAGHAEALVCFSPVDLVAERTTDGDIVISWFRRSRLGRTLMSGVDIPLGETVEAFSIDILELHSPASPEIVLRTLASSTTSVRYSLAEQHTDYGSPLPPTIKIAVYQLSSIVGRGTPAIAILTVT